MAYKEVQLWDEVEWWKQFDLSGILILIFASASFLNCIPFSNPQYLNTTFPHLSKGGETGERRAQVASSGSGFSFSRSANDIATRHRFILWYPFSHLLILSFMFFSKAGKWQCIRTFRLFFGSHTHR
jgi:hypothetical protein